MATYKRVSLLQFHFNKMSMNGIETITIVSYEKIVSCLKF